VEEVTAAVEEVTAAVEEVTAAAAKAAQYAQTGFARQVKIHLFVRRIVPEPVEMASAIPMRARA
jgi:methyl-accepting chemotaxis protein